MKKYILGIGLLLLILLVFSSPALSGVTLEFWTTQTQSDRVKTIRLIMDTFEALNPDIHVNLVPVDENQIATQMAAASAAGKIPQVFEANAALMLAFGEAKIIDSKRATALVEAIGKDRFYAGALDLIATSDASGYYALPYHGWIQGIWFRKDWFAEAGLPPPNTWENILKAARTFHHPQANQYGILLGTQADTYAEQCFTHLALSNNGGEFDGTGTLIFNSPPIRETLAFYRELAEYAPPGPQTWRGRDYYLQGKLAMFFYSTYIMDDLVMADADTGKMSSDPSITAVPIQTGLADKTAVVTTLTHARPAGYGSVVCLALGNTADIDTARAADRLITFMYEPLSYITFLHMAPGGMNPMLRDVVTNPDYLKDPMGILGHYGKENIQAIVSGFDHIGTFTVVHGTTFPASGRIYSKQIIPRMIYSAVFEDMKADDAVAWAEKEMRKIWKQP